MSGELLYAMSTAHTLHLNRFNDLLEMVYNSPALHGHTDQWDTIHVRQQVIRSFEALGFCEFDHPSAQVHMCPPTLVLLPGPGAPCALLTGARVPATCKSLQEAVLQAGSLARLQQIPQNIAGINMPSRTMVEAVDRETLATIGKAAGLSCDLDEPAAWKLANLSLSLTQINSGLSFEPRQEPNWPRRIFCGYLLTFSAVRTQIDALRLAEYRNPVSSQRRHWLWRETQATEVDRDWGRYIVLAEQERRVLLYDAKTRALAVPATAPLPALLARAVALSTGNAPDAATTDHPVVSIPAGHPILLYQDVPCVIAEIVAAKLDQILAPIDLWDIVKKRNRHD